jgi:hypothetical protein
MNSLKFPYKKYRFEIYNKPGKWMSPSELNSIQERVGIIAMKRLGMKPSFSFFKDVKYLSNKLIVLCSDRKGSTDYSCCVMSYLGKHAKTNIMHLGAVYSVDENKGLMKLIYIIGLIYSFFKNGLFRKMYITSLTHTPKIFGVVTESFDNVYPNVNPQAVPSKLHLKLKEIFINTYLREWDLDEIPEIQDSFVIKGFRVQKDGSILYPDTVQTVPRHRKKEFNERCFQMIDYHNGDEILQTGLSRGLLSFLFRNIGVFNYSRS